MKSKILRTIILLAVVSLAFGLERVDVIHLKNSDIIKGVIVENVPNDYVKIELTCGSIMSYNYRDIIKFSKETVKPPQTQSLYTSDSQKLFMYKNLKKSPATAVVLSFLLPSTGHAYAGNWSRGLVFTGLKIGSIVFANVVGEPKKDTNLKGALLTGLVALSVLELVDASNEVKKYNQKWYNFIYTGKPSLGMKITPNRDGANLMLTCNF
ncbi:MAG: hypothetical protein ISR90_04565 [Candidatus Marinimicrobia bacterium]|nr:hypothetical protein [Candidatus Neomarinimicrobiota bacterium]